LGKEKIMRLILIFITLLLLIGLSTLWLTLGSGTITKLTTISGVYAVCKPEGYNVVCFGIARNSETLSCIPLSQATKNGECK